LFVRIIVSTLVSVSGVTKSRSGSSELVGRGSSTVKVMSRVKGCPTAVSSWAMTPRK